MSFFDLDRDAHPDAVVTHGNHTRDPKEPPIGPQWTTVHRNTGGGICFQEVEGGIGLARDGDWRTLSVSDLDSDGDPDFVVGGRGISPRIYRNDIENGRNALALR